MVNTNLEHLGAFQLPKRVTSYLYHVHNDGYCGTRPSADSIPVRTSLIRTLRRKLLLIRSHSQWKCVSR